MRLLSLMLLQAMAAQAHMMSLSSGEATLEGTRLSYTLTMPLFEIAHIDHPEQALLAHIRFNNARLTTHECQSEPARESYICHATYEYPVAPEKLDVQCTLTQVTVPNHVHLLRATYGDKHDKAVFDSAFTSAVLRFRPATAAEVALQQTGNASAQVFVQILPILFLITLALAASTYFQLASLTVLFLAGQVLGSYIPWQPAPRFVECAAALAVSYLAVEIVFLPESKARSVVAFFLGVVPGLMLAAFVRQSESRVPFAILGTAIADLSVLALAGSLSIRFPSVRRIFAALTLTVSLAWFVLTLSR